MVVHYNVAVVGNEFAYAHGRLAHAHAAGAEIEHVVAHNPVPLAGTPEVDAVAGQPREGAVLDHTIGHAIAENFAAHGDCRLRVTITFGGNGPVGVGEGESAQHDMTHGFLPRDVAFEL